MLGAGVIDWGKVINKAAPEGIAWTIENSIKYVVETPTT